MASFFSDMDEIHWIVMETPNSSDGSWEYSSENETTDYSSPEEAENVNVSKNQEQQHLKHVQIIMGKRCDSDQ